MSSISKTSIPHKDFEANKKRAEAFAEEKDIFRRPSVQEKYDRQNCTVSKINASSHCMFFTKVPSTTSNKTPISIPVTYNCSINEFEEKINNAYQKINKFV